MSFPSLQRSRQNHKYWVRSEYVAINNYMEGLWENMLAEGANDGDLNSIVLTGQPGIGG